MHDTVLLFHKLSPYKKTIYSWFSLSILHKIMLLRCRCIIHLAPQKLIITHYCYS